MKINRVKSLNGEITIPGDKSISHRSIMFGSIADGITEVHGFLNGADCISSMNCFRQMGIDIDYDGNVVTVHGKGLHGLSKPEDTLDVGNSGTTTRLISGILAAQPFASRLIGDASICKRPMKRIMTPLSMMGADITSELGNDCAPLLINGKELHGIHYNSPVASAQVKSCVLLAGLYADGTTSVTEPYLSRNHTEIMLTHFGADITSKGTTATVTPGKDLHAQEIIVPGDISSAAYFIAAALMVPDSEILIKNVGINPTRDGLLRVCQDMGADITLLNENYGNGEPTADLLVRHSELHGVTVGGSVIPTLIDELPVVAALACFARGTTVIDVMVNNLRAMGAHIEGTDDGMIIEGGYPLHGAIIDSHLDHRIAMTFAITALASDGETSIKGADCVKISYPGFYEDLTRLAK